MGIRVPVTFSPQLCLKHARCATHDSGAKPLYPFCRELSGRLPTPHPVHLAGGCLNVESFHVVGARIELADTEV